MDWGWCRPSVSGRTTHVTWWWAPHTSHHLITPHTSLPHHRQAPYRSLHQMTMHMTTTVQRVVWGGCRLTLQEYCIWSHRCGSAALCHRSHPSSSHQALRRPTPSLFLTKFLPLKFLTKISPDVHCVYPPIASLVFHNSLPQRRLTFGNKSRLEGTQVLHFHHSQWERACKDKDICGLVNFKIPGEKQNTTILWQIYFEKTIWTFQGRLKKLFFWCGPKMEVGVTGFVIGVIVEAIERWHSAMIYWQVGKRLQNTRTNQACHAMPWERAWSRI